MAVDISKVFRANIKAIRMNQSDSSISNSNIDALNEELLLKKNKHKSSANQSLPNSVSVSREAKDIVSKKMFLLFFKNFNFTHYLLKDYQYNYIEKLLKRKQSVLYTTKVILYCHIFFWKCSIFYIKILISFVYLVKKANAYN